jgi:hypothetical protein
MADANARLERLHRCNAARCNTELITRRQHASAEVEEEDGLESSYIPSGRTEPSLSFTTTATSRDRSGSQLTPMQALTMAQELLRYQPIEGSCEDKEGGFSCGIITAQQAKLPNCPTRSRKCTRLPLAPPRKS